MKKRLNRLLAEIPYRKLNGERKLTVTGIHFDSRSVEPGGAFVAIYGEHTDGHDFIPEAVKNGANVVFGELPASRIDVTPRSYVQVEDSRKLLAHLSHIFFDKPSQDLFVVGITGTNGKTTTAHLAGRVLGKDSDLITTLTHSGSLPEKEPVTTPEAPIIHEIARNSLSRGATNLVLEVSSHGLSLNRVDWVNFDCGVFTNLSRDHLDFYGSMEEYASAKLNLFRQLPESGRAILNADEELSDSIVDVTAAETVKYGIEKNSGVRAEDISENREGTAFKLESPWGSTTIRLNFPGLYNVYNALAAATIGLVRDIDLSVIAERLETAEDLSGRLERIKLDNGADVYVDFAHNPGALKRTLVELRKHYKDIILVFGCGGMSDRGKRPEMGRIAGDTSDRFFITDDNPKGENRKKILSDIERGVKKTANYEVIPDRKSAVEAALEELTPDSCLLVAGKGHERHQIVSGEWIEYNDRDFIEKIAEEKSLI